MTLAQQLSRLESLLDSIDPAVLAWFTRALDDEATPEQLRDLQADVEAFVSSLCDSVEAAGPGPAARRQALGDYLRHATQPTCASTSDPAPVADAPAAPAATTAPARPAAPAAGVTHTIAELIRASHEAAATGTVAGTVVDTWALPGYVEYRLSDGAETLVIGVRDSRAGLSLDHGQDVVTTVRIAKGAATITEPIDPRRPSVLGAVPAELLEFRPV